MLFQCWVNKKTEDGFSCSKEDGDSLVINHEFEGFNQEIDEEE